LLVFDFFEQPPVGEGEKSRFRAKRKQKTKYRMIRALRDSREFFRATAISTKALGFRSAKSKNTRPRENARNRGIPKTDEEPAPGRRKRR
jgi:hypothetical protein